MSAKPRGGKKKGSVTYSDDHLLDLCDQDETMVAFYAWTGDWEDSLVVREEE